MLATLFGLLCIIFLVRPIVRKSASWIFSAFCFWIALLCKESAIAIVPLALLCCEFEAKNQLDLDDSRTSSWKSIFLRTTRISVLLGAVFVFYMMMRKFAAVPTGRSFSFTVDTATQTIQATAFYLMQLFTMQPQIAFPPLSFAPDFLPSLFVLLLIFAWIVWYTKKHKVWLDTPVFALFWSLVGIFPALLVIVLATDTNVLSERYLYTASIGFCLGLAWLCSRLFASRRTFALLSIVLLLLVGSIKTIYVGQQWRDNFRLWTYVLDIVPEHEIAWTSLCFEHERQMRTVEQIAVAKLGLQYLPESEDLAVILLKSSRKSGKVEGLELLLDKFENQFPKSLLIQREIGLSRLNAGQLDEAEQIFLKSLKQDPSQSALYVNLAMIESSREQPKTAQVKEYLRTAIELDRLNAMAYNNLGAEYYAEGRLHEAENCFLEALAIAPEMSLAKDNLRLIRNKK